MTEGQKVKNYCLEKCVPEYINYKLEAEVQQGTNFSKEKKRVFVEGERVACKDFRRRNFNALV